MILIELARILRPRHFLWQIRERFRQIRRTVAILLDGNSADFAKRKICFGKAASANDASERFAQAQAITIGKRTMSLFSSG